jgi:excisionase family DNA binding protein
MITPQSRHRLPLDRAAEIRKEPPSVMTLMESAAFLTCSPRKLRELIAQNKVKCTRIGQRIVIKREWLESFLGN